MDLSEIKTLFEFNSFIKINNELYILKIPINVMNDESGGFYLGISDFEVIYSLSGKQPKVDLNTLLDKSIIRSIDDLKNYIYSKCMIDPFEVTSIVSDMLIDPIRNSTKIDDIFYEGIRFLLKDRKKSISTLSEFLKSLFPKVNFIYWNYKLIYQ